MDKNNTKRIFKLKQFQLMTERLGNSFLNFDFSIEVVAHLLSPLKIEFQVDI